MHRASRVLLILVLLLLLSFLILILVLIVILLLRRSPDGIPPAHLRKTERRHHAGPAPRRSGVRVSSWQFRRRFRPRRIAPRRSHDAGDDHALVVGIEADHGGCGGAAVG